MGIVEAIRDQTGESATLTVSGSGPAGEAPAGGKPAGEEPVISWAQLHQRARRMATVLAGSGTGRGSRVGLLADPSVDLVAALQAVWLAGASITVLPRPPLRSGLHQLRPILADADLDLVVIGPEPAPVAPAALAPTPVLTLAELARRARSAAPLPVRPPHPADLAVLQYTSGSTRTPRGVPVTHRHLAAQLAALRRAFLPVTRRPQPMLSWLPLCHDLGLVGFLAFPMAEGWPLVLQSPACFALRPASWLAGLSRYRSVVTGAPDFAYRLVTPALEAGLDIDLGAVRLMLSGGEPISTGAMARFLAAAQRYRLDPGAVVAAYGLAEATLAVSCAAPGAGLTVDPVDPVALERDGRARPARPGQPARELARLGRPVPGTQLRIVDRTTGALAGDREVGEVEVQGPSVVGHYWGQPPAPPGFWLRTGDLGYLAGGELVVCGRSKEVLFAAGRNLYPPDIEAAADQVPGVRPGGAVAFGIPTEQGDRLVVLVETRRGADRPTVRRAVTVAVTAQTGLRPADVIPLAAGRLPRTTSGKLRRAEARRRYLAGELDRSPTPKGGADDHSDHRTGTVDQQRPRLVPSGTRRAA